MRISVSRSTKINGLFALVLMAFLGCKNEPERPIEITSPGGLVQVHFFLKEGEAFYSVSRNHAALINESKLGFELKNDKPLNKNFKVTSTKYTSLDETWTQPWGEVKDIRN